MFKLNNYSSKFSAFRKFYRTVFLWFGITGHQALTDRDFNLFGQHHRFIIPDSSSSEIIANEHGVNLQLLIFSRIILIIIQLDYE